MFGGVELFVQLFVKHQYDPLLRSGYTLKHYTDYGKKKNTKITLMSTCRSTVDDGLNDGEMINYKI